MISFDPSTHGINELIHVHKQIQLTAERTVNIADVVTFDTVSKVTTSAKWTVRSEIN